MLETLASNKLSQSLIESETMLEYINHISEKLAQSHPDYELVTTNIADYYQMPIVTEFIPQG